MTKANFWKKLGRILKPKKPGPKPKKRVEYTIPELITDI